MRKYNAARFPYEEWRGDCHAQFASYLIRKYYEGMININELKTTYRKQHEGDRCTEQ